MLAHLARKIFGSKNQRVLKGLQPLVEEIGQAESAVQDLSPEELRAKTDTFRERIREATADARKELAEAERQARELAEQPTGDADDAERRDYFQEEKKRLEEGLRTAEAEVLDELLPEAYAVVREASRRVTGMRHYDSQLVGGIVLHQGRIAEMKTGEGKTLVATLPLYLNALTGRGAHLVTVNDYLARRDVQWMGPIYHSLGLTVASISHDASYVFDPTHVVKDYRFMNLRPVSRQEGYAADVTYGTNNEYGFDYLRDNMKFSLEEYAQRELNFAIVDEVDNILIDEARTPLIISGPSEESTEKYYSINRVIPRLQRETDYTIDEKLKTATLTEDGVSKVERILGVRNLYDPAEIGSLHHVNQSLKAHAIFKRDVDYVVKDGEIIIVDEFTGRLMPGRRWSDGLHQAVEAKEGVRIREENQTLATITIQNYFRMYHKLGGMTGTADTEAVEFKKIYDLDVVVIPPNRPMVRIDHPDVVYKTQREKFDAVIEDIVDCHERGQPVLVGTVSVEKSEHLSRLLKRRKIKHNVLNAVNHEAEANVIAQAGRRCAVTIATNMAGRGTDILLGGNPEFLARSDIEKQWISRASAARFDNGKSTGKKGGKSGKSAGRAATPSDAQPEHGTEDRLEAIRAEYNAAVERARETYEPVWTPFEEARNTALTRMTETFRPYLHAALQKARADYGEAAETLHTGDGTEAARLETYTEAREAYENALIEYDKVVGPALNEEQQREYETARADFLAVLSEDSAAGSESLDLVRGRYEDWLEDYCQSIVQMAGSVSPATDDASDDRPPDSDTSADVDGTADDDGSLAGGFESARCAYENSQAAYREADARYEEARKPYEDAVAAAERAYEQKRKEHVQVIEEVREQLEKAPDLYRDRYAEVLADYERVCVEERKEVVAAGGLHILGTERHESRRIDNQLRGRAGRQGDPGSSRFFLSLEDDLLRIFGAERVQKIMDKLGMEEGEPIEHGLVTRAIENAQGRVEGHNFDIRKHLLEYDDVINKQREVIYQQRRGFLSGEHLKGRVVDILDDLIDEVVATHLDASIAPEDWDWDRLDDNLFRQFNLRLDLDQERRDSIAPDELERLLRDRIVQQYDDREEAFTPPVMRYLEKVIMLQTMDALWKDHLFAMDHLKEGIGLRGYGQKNPLQEYKKEAFDLFSDLSGRMQEEVVEKLYTVQVARPEDVQRMEERQSMHRPVQMTHDGPALLPQAEPAPAAMPAQGMGPGAPAQAARPTQVVRDTPKVGRNAPCPCGSGKKYKKCHGA